MCGVDPTTRASNLTKRTLMTNAPTASAAYRFCGACVERGSQASKGQGPPVPGAGCGAPCGARRWTRGVDAIEVARDASARARTLAVHNKPRDALQAAARLRRDYLEERGTSSTPHLWRRRRRRRPEEAKEEAERAATDIARQAAQEATPRGARRRRRRRPAADRGARGAAARVAAAAKDARGRDRDHAVAYALGDRDDAPSPRRRPCRRARLPRPVGPPRTSASSPARS